MSKGKIQLELLIILIVISFVKADSPQPKILLVDDAHFNDNGISSIYEQALQSNGYTHDLYNVSNPSDDGPPLDVLNQYDIVIWFTGKDGRYYYYQTLTKNDEINLKEYLLNGGKLFLTGQDIGFDRGNDPDNTNFYPDYLHGYFCQDRAHITIKIFGYEITFEDKTLDGLDGNPVGDGLSIYVNDEYPSVIFYREDRTNSCERTHEIFCTEEDKIFRTTNTAFKYYRSRKISCDNGEIIDWTGNNDYANGAITFDSGGPSGYKVVYFAFGLESIDESLSNVDRKTLLKRIVEYLSAPDVINTQIYPEITNSYLTLNATCIDEQHLSYVTGAEYFIDNAPNVSIRGTPMNASDGTFNESIENINVTIDVSSLNEGNHTIYVRCRDKDGYWGKFDSKVFIIDRTPPSSPFITIEDDRTYTNKEKPKLTIIDSSYGSNIPDYIRFSCDGVSWSSWIPWTINYSNFNITSDGGCNNSDGNKRVYVQAKDTAGNIQNNIRYDEIILDRVNPEIISIFPPNNSYLNSSTNITINANDSLSGIKELIFNNGTTNKTFSNNVEFNPGWTSEGLNFLKIYVYDNALNYIVKEYRYVVDNGPPITSDNSTSSWNSEDQVIKLSCNDQISHCSFVKYCLGNNSCIPSTIANISYDVLINVGCPAGNTCERYLRYQSNDSAGNLESVKMSNAIRIDKENPEVFINNPLSGLKRGTILINVSVRDSGSGTETVGYNLSNSTFSYFSYLSYDGIYWIGLLNTEDFSDGVYNLTVYAYDSVGNLNSTEKVEIVIDNTAPVTVDNSTSAWSSENQTILLECSDSLSGCSYIRYCIGSASCNPDSIADISSGSISLEVGCNPDNECQKYIRYGSNDSAGNLENLKTSNEIRIDKKGPYIIISNPKQNQVLSGIIDIIVDISDLGSGIFPEANYSILNATNLAVIEQGVLNESQSWYASWNSSGYNGEVMLNITAIDNVGNIAKKNVTFIVDNQKPYAVIVIPREEFKNQTFRMELRGSRYGGVNISNASYYIKNASGIIQSNISTNINNQSFVFRDFINLSDPKWSDGNYTINFTVVDELGGTASDKTWFFIDTQGPLTTDNYDGKWYGNDVEVLLNCTDNVMCESTWYCINDSGKACNTFQKYVGNLIVGCPENSVCNKTIKYYSKDIAGNIEILKNSSPVLIDKKSPYTSDNSSENWTNENQTIVLNATDNGSGINITLYCVDNVGICQPNLIYSGSIEIGCIENSSCLKYVRYYSIDLAGNVENVKISKKIRIDKKPPESSVTPDGSNWTNSNITFSIACSDQDSGCSKTFYKVVNMSETCSNQSGFIQGNNGEVTCNYGQNCIKKICFFSQDVAGNNESIKESSAFRIDVKPPSLLNMSLNISQDPFYGDRRVHLKDKVQFNATLSDPRNISEVFLEINGTNYTLNRIRGNKSTGVWSTEEINTSFSGYYVLERLYALDSLNNILILNSSEINLSFRVVKGSLKVLLNGSNSVNAGDMVNLNLTFYPNLTVKNPFLNISIPSEYLNLTSFSCYFGNSCSEKAYFDGENVMYLNITGQGEGRKLTLSSYLLARNPLNDTNSSWKVKYGKILYEGITLIRAPLFRIVNISCSVQDCVADQNQTFSITVNLKNIRNNFHTGKISSVILNISSSIYNKSVEVGDLRSNESSQVSFNLSVENSGNYTIKFIAHGNSNKYNHSKEINVSIRDNEAPKITALKYLEDNIVTINSTINISASVEDNVGVDSVWITIEKNSSRKNVSFFLERGSRKDGEWILSYNNTGETGRYNLTKIYANDTSGNIFAISPANFSENLSYFEVRELKLNVSFKNDTIEIGKNQTIIINVWGNGSSIANISLKVIKPGNVNDTLIPNFINSSNGTFIYSATYSNISRSGNYSVLVEIYAGSYKKVKKNFFVPFGNISINKSQENLSILKNSMVNISWILFPVKGDVLNVTIKMNSSNNSIAKVIENNITGIDLTYDRDRKGKVIFFRVQSFNTGEVNLSIEASANNSSYSVNVPLKVIDNDTVPPKIRGIEQNFSIVNLLEPVKIKVNFTDNAWVEKGILEVIYPNSSYSENFSMENNGLNEFGIEFFNTSRTGNYRYKIYIKDVGGNFDYKEGNFSVSSDYKLIILTDKKYYNKGERVNITFEVRNVNNLPINGFNLTAIIEKDGINETLENNSQKSSLRYLIKASDPPDGDNPSNYIIYARVEKNGNKALNETMFKVFRILNTVFVYPLDLQTFKVGEDVPLRINVTNARGEAVSSASVIARCLACKESGGQEFLQLEYNSSSKLYYSNSFKAPKTENNRFTIAVYSIDAFKNYQGDPSTPPFVALSTEEFTSGTTSQSGGGGGFVAGPSIEILNPKESILPYNTKEVELKIKTSRKASCEYSSHGFEFGKGTAFSTEDGIVHNALIKVEPGNTYAFRIKCKSGELIGEEVITFTISKKEIVDFEVKLTDFIKIIRGHDDVIYAILSNKGNVPLMINSKVVNKECCRISFNENVMMEEKSEMSLPISIHVPLNTSPGEYNIVLSFKNGSVIKERIVKLIVEENDYVKILKELSGKINSTIKEINEYKKSGINTESLELGIKNVKNMLENARKAINQDNLTDLKEYVLNARNEYSAITRTLLALKIVKFFKDNWWKMLSGFLIVYSLFYATTLLLIPYISLKQRLNLLKKEEEEHIHARKRVERQYFNRVIDKDTFMKIMTNEQREILRIRGSKDSVEREIANLFRERLNLKTFIKAPVIAIYEMGKVKKNKERKK